MTRRGWQLAVGLGLAVGAGCSEKPRAIQEAKELKSAGAEKTVEMSKEPAPEKSDPAAAKVVADAVAAHTGGQPDRLNMLRTVMLTRNGSILATDPPIQAKWHVRAVWPDKYRTDIEVPGTPKITFCRSGDSAWRFKQLEHEKKEVFPPGPDLRGVIADTTYEWLAVLTPLADPGLVAAPAADAAIGGRPATGVSLSGKNLPRAVVHFDKETKLLVQFAYEGMEAGSSVLKEVRVMATRETNGVKVPDKLFMKWGGRPAAEWTIDKIEFPAIVPPSVFDEP